jgi:hypothetical protein
MAVQFYATLHRTRKKSGFADATAEMRPGDGVFERVAKANN